MSEHPILPDAPNEGADPSLHNAAPPAGRYGSLAVVPDDVHVLDFVRVLYRRRWAAVTIFLIVLLSAVAYTFTATPIYEARTRLLIDSDAPSVVSFKAVVDEAQPNPDYYQTQYGILQSRELARRTITTLGLWNSPEIGGHGATVAAADTTDKASAADLESRQSDAIDSFLSRLTIEPLRNSRLVDVKFRSTSPVIAARVANQLAQHYIEHSLEYKYVASRDASTWLGGQLAQQRKAVDAAEAALQQYREQNDAVSEEDHDNIVVQKLGELNTALTRAKTDRLQKEAVEHQLEAIENDPAALAAFPAILDNPFIRQQKAELQQLQRSQAELAGHLGTLHPDMLKVQSAIDNVDAKMRTETANIVRSVHTEYEAARTQEQSLLTALEQQKREALSMNRKSIQYSVLAREVESNRQIYNSLLQREKETGVSEELRSSNIRVIDNAEQPRSPISPRTKTALLVAASSGILLAIAFAFFYEHVDSRIKTPDEIKAALGLPSLAMIPALGKRWASGSPLLHNGVPPTFSEVFRTLRTNILFSTPQGQPRTIVVTSTGPGEGKTMVASNLAIACALAGQRTLLIDADMRRSQAHDLFNVDLEPGLSNVIVGDSSVSSALQRTAVGGLWVLAAGRTPPNPAELLGSARFKDVIAASTTRFDTIIIDTPPAMVVTDPLVVAHIASGVLFVVGAEMTSRFAAREVLEQLERSHARLIGAVLNRVEIEKNGYYYYSRYDAANYTTYYGNATP
jgi:capsular exopolysaccharide synthesis family protein